MAVFRLVHLSDLHIAVKQERVGGLDLVHQWGTRWRFWNLAAPSSWSKLLGDVVTARLLRLNQAKPLDAILLSGDLATTGSKADLALAWNFATELANCTKWPSGPENDPLNPQRRLILFPGNHDRFRTWPYWPGDRKFDGVFANFWKPPVQTTLLANNSGPEKLAIIQADFCLQKKGDAVGGGLNYLGQGMVYEDSVLKDLEAETKEQRKQSAVVWAIHFPPDFPKLSLDMRLQCQIPLLDKANELDIKHIFTGHTHQWREYDVRGITVHCAGSATQYYLDQGERNTIHPLEVEVDPGGSIRVKWDTEGWYGGSAGFAKWEPMGRRLP